MAWSGPAASRAGWAQSDASVGCRWCARDTFAAVGPVDRPAASSELRDADRRPRLELSVPLLPLDCRTFPVIVDAPRQS